MLVPKVLGPHPSIMAKVTSFRMKGWPELKAPSCNEGYGEVDM